MIEGINQGIDRYVNQFQLNMKRRNDGLVQWEKRLTGQERVDWNQNQELNGMNGPNASNYLSMTEDSASTFSSTLAEIRAQSIPNYSKENTQNESGSLKKSEKAVIQAPAQAVARNKNEALTQPILGRNMMTSVDEAYPYPLNYNYPYLNRYIGSSLNSYYPFYTVTPSVDKLY